MSHLAMSQCCLHFFYIMQSLYFFSNLLNCFIYYNYSYYSGCRSSLQKSVLAVIECIPFGMRIGTGPGLLVRRVLARHLHIVWHKTLRVFNCWSFSQEVFCKAL